MPAAKAFVFDLGKVLVDFDYSIAARQIAAHSPRSEPEVRVFLDQSDLLVRYECGQISTLQFFEEIRRLTDFRGTLEEFSDYFADIFTEIPPMIELHERVSRQGMPTYIFSNSNELAIRHVRRRFPFFEGFDGYILSFEHGVMKPDARLYEVVERQARLAGSEILYLDDRPENVAAGAARGWHSIRHESPATTLRKLEDLGWLHLDPHRRGPER